MSTQTRGKRSRTEDTVKKK